MSFCPSCGTPATPGATSCAKCGAPIAAAAPPAPFGSTPSYSAPSPAGMPGAAPYGLPETSNTSIILACLSWVCLGIFMSVPAFFMARSEIRGIREGRYSPNSLSKANLAWWLSLIQIVFTFVICGGYILVFGAAGVMFYQQEKRMREEETKARAEMSVKETAALESDIDAMVAAKGSDDVSRWKKMKASWADAKKDHKAGKPVSDDPTNDLIISRLFDDVGDNPRLFFALVVYEEKMADECGLRRPIRVRHDPSSMESHSHHGD